MPKAFVYKFYHAEEPFTPTTYLENLNKKCWECGSMNVALHNHHPVPRSRGGKRTIPLCEKCHAHAHHRKKRMNTSALVKEAYQRKKREALETGIPMKPWGNPEMVSKVQPMGQAVRRENARKYSAAICGMLSEIDPDDKLTLEAKAEALNAIGSTSRRGRTWNKHSLHRVIAYNRREQT